jgi:hypothetical protein
LGWGCHPCWGYIDIQDPVPAAEGHLSLDHSVCVGHNTLSQASRSTWWRGFSLADKLSVRSEPDKANTDEPSVPRRMATIDPKDILGRTLLKDSESDGQRFRARIVRAILEIDADMKRDLSMLSLCVKLTVMQQMRSTHTIKFLISLNEISLTWIVIRNSYTVFDVSIVI